MSTGNNQDNKPSNNLPGRGESKGDASALHMHDSTFQSGEEYQADKNNDHTDDKITASGVDDLQSNSGGAAGTDRAGTAERKPYGDTKLNPGLEEQ